MSLTVLIEPSLSGGFRAATGGPIPMEVHAASRDEALDKIKSMLRLRAADGAVFLDLESSNDHAFSDRIGFLKDEPLFDEWQQAIQEYRDQDDRNEGLS